MKGKDEAAEAVKLEKGQSLLPLVRQSINLHINLLALDLLSSPSYLYKS